MKILETEGKLYQIEVVARDDAGRRVKVRNRTQWAEGWQQNWDPLTSNWR